MKTLVVINPKRLNNWYSRHAYISTLRSLDWKKVAALTQEGAKYSDFMSNLQDEFQNNNIQFVINRKFPKESSDMSMVTYHLSYLVIVSSSFQIAVFDRS